MAERILIVDDDRKIARVVQTYLEEAGMTTLLAYDGETAMHMIRHERPDLVVLDIMLPKYDGWEITRWLRHDHQLASIPILMLTARVEDSDKIHGFELGADDYLTKPFNPQEVVVRVKAILRRARHEPLHAHILESGNLRLDIDNRTVTLEGENINITPTEFMILRALMEHPNHNFTRDELIERALGYTYDGLDRTLDSHIKNLRRKIEKDPAHPCFIETVFGIGYRFNEAGV